MKSLASLTNVPFKPPKYFALLMRYTNNVLLLDANDFFILFNDDGGVFRFLIFIILFI